MDGIPRFNILTLSLPGMTSTDCGNTLLGVVGLPFGRGIGLRTTKPSDCSRIEARTEPRKRYRVPTTPLPSKNTETPKIGRFSDAAWRT
jgi:hypothetical protein